MFPDDIPPRGLYGYSGFGLQSCTRGVRLWAEMAEIINFFPVTFSCPTRGSTLERVSTVGEIWPTLLGCLLEYLLRKYFTPGH